MWYDFAVAAILLFCMVRGAKKGFLWQLAGIAAVVLCFVFAETASLAIAPYLKIDPPLNRWVSMLLLYVACSFVCFAVARAMQNGLEKAKFEDYDRHLGGLVGLLKGAGIAVVLTFFAVTLSETLRPAVLGSHSGHAAAVVMDKLSPVFPEELGKVLEPHLKEFQGFEEEYHSGQLAGGSEDPGDLFDDNFGGFDDFDAPGGGDAWDEPDGFGEPGPLAGGGSPPTGDGFGDDPRFNGRPVSGEGAFGDSARGDFGAAPGAGGDWQNDGRLNTDRLRNEAGNVARDLWNDVPEETRRNLTDSLTESATNAARRRVEDEWGVRLDDFLGDPSQPAAEPAANRPTRQELIAEIAAIYNRDENVQSMIRQQSARALGPVPEEAALDVLQDWLADLRGPAAGPDPDPGTTKATTLRERITRRLTARTARPGETAPRR
ncbi:CvpA family protein [Alienimonas sp. DA493]|uniref:CvpA family protein n=1 Tax=Alienimonas sp. DA493 TaxID=3373605 RepID=UPI00375534B4